MLNVTFFIVVILLVFSVALSPVLIVSTKVRLKTTPPKKEQQSFPQSGRSDVDNYIWQCGENKVHLPGSGNGGRDNPYA
jgi:hypothetical protein